MTARNLFPVFFCAWFLILTVAQVDDDDVEPAPPSIGADVPLTYFGPPPSSVQKELVGPLQLLTAGQIDQETGTIQLPLYTGYYADGTVHYYILTDTTDSGFAKALGLNFAAKLNFITAGNGVDDTPYLNGSTNQLFGRKGQVDFTPERNIVPGDEPTPFPPKTFEPGAIGDKNYSPYVRINNIGGSVWNAPIVASGIDGETLNKYCDGVPEEDEEDARKYIHDKVLKICPEEQTVSLELIPGFSFAKPIQYLSTEASDALPAAVEGNTFAPRLSDITVGGDDSAFSGVERLFAVVNGFSNIELQEDGRPEQVVNHPGRSGFNSALRGEGGPLNVLGGIPTVATDYSPAWDLNVGAWTAYAVEAGLRARWLDEFQVLAFAELGLVTAPDGAPFGSSGFIVNCPIVNRFL